MLVMLILPGWVMMSMVSVSGFKLSSKNKESSQFSTPYKFLMSVSLSYGLFAFAVAIARLMQLSYIQFSSLVWFYCAIVILLASLLLWQFTKQVSYNLNVRNCVVAYLPVATIVLLFGFYHLYVGAYSEIPADIYFHVEKFRQIYSELVNGEIEPIHSFSKAVKQDIEVWYYLLAWIAINTQISTADMLQTATLVSQSLFLFAIYHFALRVFNHHRDAVTIACLVTILVFMHFGVSAFSYVRYYALAPAMLGFVLYLSAIVVCLNLLGERRFEGAFFKVFFLIFTLIAAVLIHTQEAMFIVIHLSIMICFFAFSLMKNAARRNQKKTSSKFFGRTVIVLASMIVMFFCVAYYFAHYNLTHFGDNGNRLIEFGVAKGILPQLAILNPSYQFIQVVTLWGVLVYGLFFLNWSRYKDNLILLSGMLLPFITVFNPIFTDLFLRFTDSTVLWRFCFLIPIHYVAADLIVMYLRRLILTFETTAIRHTLQRIFAGLALASMALLLLPFYNGWRDMHYSRYPTLRVVANTQSYQHLDDVIEFLTAMSAQKELLTDPVTGYILSGFTPHLHYRDKFFITPYSGFKRFHFEDYDDAPLDKYTGKLLVVNQRTINNGNSFVGAVTRHWPTDLFQRITPFYPKVLLEYLQDNPAKFELLFQSQDVKIYLIQ